MMPGMSKQFIRVPRWCSLILSRADNEQVPGLRGVHPRYPAFTTSSVTRTFEGYTLDGSSPPFESRTI